MRFTIERDALLDLTNLPLTAAARGGTIPILEHVLLSAKDDGLHATGSDLDVEAADQVACRTERQGQVAVPGQALHDIAKNLPQGGEICVEYDPAVDPRLQVRCARSRYQLPVLPAGDFPTMKTSDFINVGLVGAKELRRLIDKTRFAVCNDKVRYYMGGLHLTPSQTTADGGDRRLRAVAVHGHFLAMAEIVAPDGMPDFPPVTVPQKGLTLIQDLLEGGAVEVRASTRQIQVQHDLGAVTATLIDGSFPDYQRVIPRDLPHVLEVDVELMQGALKRTLLITQDKARGIRLNLRDGALAITARNDTGGIAHEELEVGYDGPDLEIGYNGRYLQDILAHVEGESASIRLGDAMSACAIYDSADPTAVFVLMPIRV